MEVCGQLHAPVPLPPGKESPVIHWIGGWVGRRAGSVRVDRTESLSPLGIESRSSNP